MAVTTKTSVARQFLLKELGLDGGVFVKRVDGEWEGCTFFSYRTETPSQGTPQYVTVTDGMQARFLTDEETYIYNATRGNPYAAIRKETVENAEPDGTRRIEITGYDKNGHVVEHTTKIYYTDGREGHFSESVGEDGYWRGGFSDYMPDGAYCSGQTAQRKFDENE